ncbi:MAG TPA: hypothetical protein VKS79_00945 [Gemmataceae bacterium]|nr:hypothetical protein [Gemmataceae bacterium]
MTAFIFVPLLAITCILSGLIWTFLSHAFLVVVEDTAAGNRDIVWPDDSFLDFFWKAFYLAWLVGVWIAPAMLVARLAAPAFPEEVRQFWYFALAGVVLWVVFPISLLSSMAAESLFTVLHGGLAARLAFRSKSLFLFYLVSIPVVLIGAGLAAALCLGETWYTLLFGAFGVSYCILTYGRLTGRLACLVRLTRLPFRKRKNKQRRPTSARSEVTDPWKPPPQEEAAKADAKPHVFVQPEDLPGVHSPWEGEDITGYNVRFDDAPATKLAPASQPLDPGEAIPVAEEEAPRHVEEDHARAAARAIKPDRLEMERLSRKKEREPKSPWTEGIWLFAFSRATMIPFGFLTLAFLLLGLAVRGLRLLWPQ